MKVCLAFDYAGINHRYHKELWEKAISALGWRITSPDECDVAVMWGIGNPPTKEFALTRRAGKPVMMVDFPYWNRGARDGQEYYKVSLNGQHPTQYIMKEAHSPDRYINTRGMPIEPWKKSGEFIMVAGMGAKAAVQNGYRIGQWEHGAINKIKRQTKLPIIYRPKPNRGTASIIDVKFDAGLEPIDVALRRCELLVCHHGNPTVFALAQGIPIIMKEGLGAASLMATHNLDNIGDRKHPPEREQFLYNLAHWQFSVNEIESGYVFRDFVNRGLI